MNGCEPIQKAVFSKQRASGIDAGAGHARMLPAESCSGDRALKPAWVHLYALPPVSVVLLVLIDRVPFTGAWHTLVQCGIVLAAIGLAGAWLRANRAALLRGSDTPERDIPVLVIVIPPHSGGCDAAPAAKDADSLPTRNPLRPGAFLLDPATSTTPRASHRED